jgi:hypothetical protein
MQRSHTTAPEPEATATRQRIAPLDPWMARRLQRGSIHLVRLGPRALAEYLSELADRIGGLPAALALLAEYERRLTPETIRLAGGDRFPPRPLRLVQPT